MKGDKGYFDKAMSLLAVFLGILLAVVLLVLWNSIPQSIPAHWFGDSVDRWGQKWELLILPVICLAIGLLLSFFSVRRNAEDSNDKNGDICNCWDDIGVKDSVSGHVSKGFELTSNAVKWLGYLPDNEKCKTCNVFPLCMGGCPRVSLLNGELDCDTARYNIQQKIRLMLLAHEIELGDADV